jgi:hypothetical protein
MEKVQRRTRDELYESFGCKPVSKEPEASIESQVNVSHGMSAMEVAMAYEEEYLG